MFIANSDALLLCTVGEQFVEVSTLYLECSAFTSRIFFGEIKLSIFTIGVESRTIFKLETSSVDDTKNSLLCRVLTRQIYLLIYLVGQLYRMLDNRLKNFSKSIKTVDTNQQ